MAESKTREVTQKVSELDLKPAADDKVVEQEAKDRQKSRSAKRAKAFWNKVKSGPKPDSLSKEATPLKNDPAWTQLLDSVEVPVFQEEVTDRRFMIEGKTFDEAMEVTYHEMAIADPDYRKTVSHSMAAYHGAVSFFVRAATIIKDQGRATPAVRGFADELPLEQISTPEPIGKYLDGIGNCQDARGDAYQPYLDIPGHRAVLFPFITNTLYLLPAVNAGTISDWCSVPQPAIFLARVAADMRYSITNNPAHRMWRIPGVADDPNTLLPGWREASKLRVTQLDWLKRNGWTYGAGRVTIPLIVHTGFSLQSELFWRVNTITSRVRTYRIQRSISTAVEGSCGQLPWIFGSINLEGGDFGVRTSEKMDPRACLISLQRGYRWRRPKRNWFPFEGAHPTWIGHENDRFSRYESSGINLEVYQTAMIRRREVIQDHLRRFRVAEAKKTTSS